MTTSQAFLRARLQAANKSQTMLINQSNSLQCSTTEQSSTHIKCYAKDMASTNGQDAQYPKEIHAPDIGRLYIYTLASQTSNERG